LIEAGSAMEFALTAEQQNLRDTAKVFLAVRRPDVHAWPEIVTMGWLDAELGGVELAVLAEESGYALAPARWFTTAALAQPAYLAAGRNITAAATLAWAEPPMPIPLGAAGPVRCRAAAEPGRCGLTGHKRWVPEASTVDETVVLAGDASGVALYRVDLVAHRDAVRELSTVDSTRPVAELRLAATPAEQLVGAEQTPAVLRHIRARAYTMLSAEALGVARRALDLAVDYAGTRTQFGRPIGAYQGVAHRLADAYTAQELTRSLVYRAAWTVDSTAPGEVAPDTDEAVLAAVVAAKQAAMLCCETAIQVLGGVGFTWEHPLRPLYRRAQWLAAFDGSPAAHRAELAALVLDRPATEGPAQPMTAGPARPATEKPVATAGSASAAS